MINVREKEIYLIMVSVSINKNPRKPAIETRRDTRPKIEAV